MAPVDTGPRRRLAAVAVDSPASAIVSPCRKGVHRAFVTNNVVHRTVRDDVPGGEEVAQTPRRR
jgi:hypothetical protein